MSDEHEVELRLRELPPEVCNRVWAAAFDSWVDGRSLLDAFESSFPPEEVEEEVESTNIVKWAYSSASATLTVWFKNGTAYRYEDVPQDEFDVRTTYASPGKYVHEVIKPHSFIKLGAE